jgi:hypothetical protein
MRAGHVAGGSRRETRNAYRILVQKLLAKRTL